MNRWADFQKNFGAAITRPLDTSSGTLRSQWLDNPGVAAYNRQYWFRLFTTLQQEYPLLARLQGFWNFNLVAQEFLQEHPPRDYDLQHIANDFPGFLRERRVESILIQAAVIDKACREVFLAPPAPQWQLTEEIAATLGQCQLIAAPTWRLVSEDWDLMEWSRQFADASLKPKACESTQHWLILRQNSQILHQRLPTEQATFYRLLTEYPVGVALGLLGEQFPTLDLAPCIHRWMQQSTEWGLWAGP